MYQMIYSSSEKQPFRQSDLKKLLVNARLRNTEVGVTGMLVFHRGTFLQALEGEHADVESIFGRISKDKRHEKIQVLHRGMTLGRRRLFGDWSMGFTDAAGAARLLKGFVDLQQAPDLSELNETKAIDLLKACAAA